MTAPGQNQSLPDYEMVGNCVHINFLQYAIYSISISTLQIVAALVGSVQPRLRPPSAHHGPSFFRGFTTTPTASSTPVIFTILISQRPSFAFKFTVLISGQRTGSTGLVPPVQMDAARDDETQKERHQQHQHQPIVHTRTRGTIGRRCFQRKPNTHRVSIHGCQIGGAQKTHGARRFVVRATVRRIPGIPHHHYLIQSVFLGQHKTDPDFFDGQPVVVPRGIHHLIVCMCFIPHNTHLHAKFDRVLVRFGGLVGRDQVWKLPFQFRTAFGGGPPPHLKTF